MMTSTLQTRYAFTITAYVDAATVVGDIGHGAASFRSLAAR
jgi:hypothetical protein